jgi:hypothetical protein
MHNHPARGYQTTSKHTSSVLSDFLDTFVLRRCPAFMLAMLLEYLRQTCTRSQNTITPSLPPSLPHQLIYDLLVKSSGPLELREDPDQGVCVAGLKRITVTSAAEIMVRGREEARRRRVCCVCCATPWAPAGSSVQELLMGAAVLP